MCTIFQTRLYFFENISLNLRFLLLLNNILHSLSIGLFNEVSTYFHVCQLDLYWKIKIQFSMGISSRIYLIWLVDSGNYSIEFLVEALSLII